MVILEIIVTIASWELGKWLFETLNYTSMYKYNTTLRFKWDVNIANKLVDEGWTFKKPEK